MENQLRTQAPNIVKAGSQSCPRRQVLQDLRQCGIHALVLPDTNHDPAISSQPPTRLTIPLYVRCQLGMPPSSVVRGPGGVLRTAMPEAAIDEHGDLPRREQNICPPTGHARQRSVHTVAVAKGVQRSPQRDLCCRVPRPLPCHPSRCRSVSRRRRLAATDNGSSGLHRFIIPRVEAGAPTPDLLIRHILSTYGDGSAIVTSDAAAPVTILDLFSGAGGLSEGFRQASSRFKVVQAVEYDPSAAATYAANHGDVVFAGPIEEWLRTAETPTVDLVVGGPPCQGFSTLGKQDAQDERNALWEYYAQTLERAQPKYFLLENVAVFLKSSQFQEFRQRTLAGSLRNYKFDAAVLNAADYGAHQSRKRAILLGWRIDVQPPSWPVKTHGPDTWRTVREAFLRVPHAVREIDLPIYETLRGEQSHSGPFTSRQLHVTRQYEPISVARFEHIPEGGNRFDLPDVLKAPCWVRHTSGSGDVMGRLRWDEPSVTIRTEFFKPEKGRYLHPTEHRAITHFEAARLQGFPDDYLWIGNKTSIARQIGNAVPIPLGAALAGTLLAALDGVDAVGQPMEPELPGVA